MDWWGRESRKDTSYNPEWEKLNLFAKTNGCVSVAVKELNQLAALYTRLGEVDSAGEVSAYAKELRQLQNRTWAFRLERGLK